MQCFPPLVFIRSGFRQKSGLGNRSGTLAIWNSGESGTLAIGNSDEPHYHETYVDSAFHIDAGVTHPRLEIIGGRHFLIVRLPCFTSGVEISLPQRQNLYFLTVP